jgi:predicted anti-sigma-YlaC factor YlaD
MSDHGKCEALLGSLSDYVDGSLRQELCREIEEHMAGCENCRVVVDTLKKTVFLYHSTSGEDAVPPEVRERLYRVLDLEDLLRHRGEA